MVLYSIHSTNIKNFIGLVFAWKAQKGLIWQKCMFFQTFLQGLIPKIPDILQLWTSKHTSGNLIVSIVSLWEYILSQTKWYPLTLSYFLLMILYFWICSSVLLYLYLYFLSKFLCICISWGSPFVFVATGDSGCSLGHGEDFAYTCTEKRTKAIIWNHRQHSVW